MSDFGEITKDLKKAQPGINEMKTEVDALFKKYTGNQFDKPAAEMLEDAKAGLKLHTLRNRAIKAGKAIDAAWDQGNCQKAMTRLGRIVDDLEKLAK